MLSFFLLYLTALYGFLHLPKRAASSCTAVTAKPTSSCGIRGTLKYELVDDWRSLALPQVVANLEQCVKLCARRVIDSNLNQSNSYFHDSPYPLFQNGFDSYCVSFSFNTETGLCQMGLLSIEDIVEPDSKSSTVYYDSECWNCGRLCPPPLGRQILDNGGFEEDLLGPWAVSAGDYYGMTQLPSRGRGHNSHFSFHGYSGMKLAQQMDLCPRNTYRFEFDYLAIAGNASHPAHFQFLIGAQSKTAYIQAIRHDILTNNTDRSAWRRSKSLYLSVESTGHTGAEFIFDNYIYPNMNNSYFIDNVNASRVPRNPTLKKGAKSLFVNGGFENGTIDGWTLHRRRSGYDEVVKYEVVSPGIHSNYGLQYNISKVLNDPFFKETSPLSQMLPTTPGSTYLFSFDARVDGYLSSVYLTFGPPDELLEYLESWKVGDHHIAIPVKAKSHKLKFELSIHWEGRNLAEYLLLDNFQFTELEKSTLFP